MRPRAGFALALLLAIALLLPAFAQASDVVVVRSEGTSTRTKDAGEAKTVAIDMALKGAVREAAQRLSDYDPGVADIAGVEDEITADPLAFVKNYRIVSEGWVSVQAAGAPGGDEGWGDGPATGPDDAWGAEDGPAPAQGAGWGDDPWAEPEEVYHISIEASVDAALLREAIARMTSDDSGGKDADITVVLIDANDYALYSRFRNALSAIPMVKELSYDSFFRGRIVFKVRASGGSLALKQRLEHEAGPEFEMLFGGRGTITAKVVPGAIKGAGDNREPEVEWR